MEKKKKNITFEEFNTVIMNCYFDYIKEKEKIPTLKQIAELTGYHINTVTTHLKEITLDKLKEKHKIKIDAVLEKLGRTYLSKGKTSDAKLFLQVIADWKESNETKIILDKEQLKKDLESFFE